MESLQESSIRSFIIWNVTSQIISKNTKTPGPSKKTFSSIQNKEILKKLNTKIQNIISNWNSARQQILVKETEMSCNLFSYLGGTNIRKHRWTKSSLRATATEYQKVWESSKKVEIGWFWREATPNFSWGKIWYDLFPSKNSSRQRLSPWREIQQPNSEILVESLQESSIRSFIIWNGTSQIITKNTKTPGPSKKTFSLIQNKEIQNKKLNTNYP